MARINRRMGSGRMNQALNSLGQDAPLPEQIGFAESGDPTVSDASGLNVDPNTGDVWLTDATTATPAPAQAASSGFSFANILNTLEQAVHYTTTSTPGGGVQIVPKNAPASATPAWVLPLGIAALALALLR